MIKIDKSVLTFGITVFLKFILFDVIWCASTTFASFSTIEAYTTKLIATLILIMPYSFWRMYRIQGVIMLLLDALLIANLMYFRTYFTAIPLHSYALSSNLADFTSSVTDSLRWIDILFPLSTVAAMLMHLGIKRNKTVHSVYSPSSHTSADYTLSAKQSRHLRPVSVSHYMSLLAVIIAIFGITTMIKGGYKTANDKLRRSAYLCSNGAAIYTVFGSIYYDLVNSRAELTPEVQTEIENWLINKPTHKPALLEGTSENQRNNCIIILAESLESWVIETEVEGQEITPYINRLLKDTTTLYAPQVLTQVKGGRSIDAQLMICTGLLPINSGTYSSQFPGNEYPSLQKAMKQFKNSRNYLLTIDKVSTWNQGVIAQSFGTDTILAYHDFELTEAFGTHKRTGDGSFLAQTEQKIENGEIWKEGENAYIQMITYSGHAPFVLPEHLREVSFSKDIPEKMAHYMTTARYTDKAIGKFVEYLKSTPKYKETLIVITGDHEGLASNRAELCQSSGGKGVVSPKQFTPFIVVNSPIGLRYNDVMGQIDIYPTLLNLLQIDRYYWTGLGTSILNAQKKGVAVGSQMNVEGDDYTQEDAEWLQKAYDISDKIISFNYFGRE